MWMSIGTFVLWLGWYFFNGGSAYSIYNKSMNPAKIITNTILSGCTAGAVAYFFKRPIHLWVSKCSQQPGQYYKTFRASQRYDCGSVCNAILAGLVAVTAPCDNIEPWAACCIGIIAGFLYCFWSRILLLLNIDDPIEASSVHYINGVWGIMSCVIFDNTKGFVSGSDQMGEFLGVQIYGVISITLWGVVLTMLFFIPCALLGWHKYHPVIELLGAHRFKMGEITEEFLQEIRRFSNKKLDTESSSGKEDAFDVPKKIISDENNVSSKSSGSSDSKMSNRGGQNKVQDVPKSFTNKNTQRNNEPTMEQAFKSDNKI